MKAIAIVNQKGGVGKTTTAAHLAWGLAAQGKRVLAIDFDPQGNLSDGMGAGVPADGKTVYDFLGVSKTVAAASFIETVRQSGGADILPANIYLDSGERSLYEQLSRERCLEKALRPVKDKYDYILIDCRPSLGLLTVNALTAADEALVPVKADYYSIPAVEQLIDTVVSVKKECNPRLIFNGFLVTMIDKRRNTDGYTERFKELAASVGTSVYETQIRLNAAAADAPSSAVSLFDYNPKCNAAVDYAAFVAEFLRREAN